LEETNKEREEQGGHIWNFINSHQAGTFTVPPDISPSEDLADDDDDDDDYTANLGDDSHA